MNAIVLGLIAALCWGFHDILVRFVSQSTRISACVFTTLMVGLIFHLGLMATQGEFVVPPKLAIWLSLIAGGFFTTAAFGLYLAFQRGPVRLVAPLIASYPILSVLVAVAQGETITALQWAAVLAIVFGVALVAALSDTSHSDTPGKSLTIFYALISAIGFAGAFALGQQAAALGHEMSTTFITRVAAIGLTIVVLVAMKQPFWPGKRVLPLLIGMGVADGIALFCVFSAGSLPDAQYTSVTASMFGLLTILLAWIWLKEAMSLPQWAGCVVAFCGVGYLAL